MSPIVKILISLIWLKFFSLSPLFSDQQHSAVRVVLNRREWDIKERDDLRWDSGQSTWGGWTVEESEMFFSSEKGMNESLFVSISSTFAEKTRCNTRKSCLHLNFRLHEINRQKNAEMHMVVIKPLKSDTRIKFGIFISYIISDHSIPYLIVTVYSTDVL